MDKYRYVFTGFDRAGGEQCNQVEIAVYANNEGSALEKAAEAAKREYYRTEAVEAMADELSVDEPEKV